jgi:3-isopropylmalate dehydrogenase
VRPTRSYPDIGCLHDDIDLVIVRENNEGFQPDRNMHAGSGEFRPTPDITLSMRVITRRASYRVAKAALELARQRRKHMTFVHKDTVFKLGCGMFVEECRRAAAEYPDVRVDDVIVDTFAMRLVRRPQDFDVVVTTNMFGDILSDEAAGLVGGLGMAPGLCIGEGRVAMAQATHGSAPDIAGQGIANPYAMIESTRMLLEWLGHDRGRPEAVAAARSMSRAMTAALRDPAARTGDIRGTGTTAAMTQAVIRGIEAD